VKLLAFVMHEFEEAIIVSSGSKIDESLKISSNLISAKVP